MKNCFCYRVIFRNFNFLRVGFYAVRLNRGKVSVNGILSSCLFVTFVELTADQPVGRVLGQNFVFVFTWICVDR